MAEVTDKEVDQYLARIAYDGARTPALETLRGLHKCHILSVPFENLSVYHREEIHLTKEWLFNKVVARSRGGFCFELNSLFSFLLHYLGFRYTMHAARVCSRKTGVLGPELDHLILLVELEGKKWLTDVGFGDSFILPLLFVEDEEQELKSGIYRIRREGDKYVYEEKFKILVSTTTTTTTEGSIKKRDGDKCFWEKRYIFDLVPRTVEDFRGMCVYHQRNPKSPFTHHRICTVARSWGRITLSKEKLVTTTYLGNNTVRKDTTELDGEEEVLVVLEKQFGIKIE